MTASYRLHQQKLIEQYINCKDNGRSELMAEVFTEDAVLTMKVESPNISFPAETKRIQAIKKVLVDDFNQQYQDIYTYCFDDTLFFKEQFCHCNWMVVMTDKHSAEVRLGCGRYDWQFKAGPVALVQSLEINIEQMQILEPPVSQQIYQQLKSINYPWCRQQPMIDLLQVQPSLSPCVKSIQAWHCHS